MPQDFGGVVVTEQLRAYYDSEQWLATRQRILTERPLCERCRSVASRQIHHRTYVRLGHERPEDILALCRECHQAVHGRRF